MTEKTAKSVNNLGYHAHIYYDPTQHTRRCRRGVRGARGAFPGRDRGLPRHADRAAPDRQRSGHFQARPVRACGALPDVAPRRARCPRPPADRGRGGGPHGFRDVARQAGRTENSHAAPRSRRAAAERRQRLALEDEGDAASRKADFSRARSRSCSRAYDQPEAGRRLPLPHFSSRVLNSGGDLERHRALRYAHTMSQPTEPSSIYQRKRNKNSEFILSRSSSAS